MSYLVMILFAERLWLWSTRDRESTVTHRKMGVRVYYRKTSYISRTLVGNKIGDNSDVVGASPVGAAPTSSSFSTSLLASMDWAKATTRRD